MQLHENGLCLLVIRITTRIHRHIMATDHQ